MPNQKQPDTCQRPCVLVVENSRQVWRGIRTKIGEIASLDFVNDEMPAQESDISIESVLRRFDPSVHTHVIMDLALTDDAEREAPDFTQDEDRVIEEAIAATNPQMDDPDRVRSILKSVFPGLRAICELRKQSPELPIIVVSNYLVKPAVVEAINRHPCLISGSGRVDNCELISKALGDWLDRVRAFILGGGR